MKFILTLMPLFLFSCMGKDVDIPLRFEGERLVIFSKLEANKPITVEVKKTFTPIGKIPNSSIVQNAKITVFQDNVLYAELLESDKAGTYFSNKKIEIGHRYRVKVEAISLPTAESAEVLISGDLPQFSFKKQLNTEGYLNTDFFQLKFSDFGNSFLRVEAEAHFESDVKLGGQFITNKVISNEEDCLIFENFQKGSMLLREECIKYSDVYDLSVINKLYKSQDEKDYLARKKVVVRIGNVSKEWFDFQKYKSKQPEGLDHLVLPNSPAYTNIKNGYGLVYGIYEKEYILSSFSDLNQIRLGNFYPVKRFNYKQSG